MSNPIIDHAQEINNTNSTHFKTEPSIFRSFINFCCALYQNIRLHVYFVSLIIHFVRGCMVEIEYA